MKPDTIKAIFTNLLFVIGVILTIVGVVQAALTVSRLIVFDAYPLQNWEESRCDRSNMVPAPEGKAAVIDPAADIKQEADCKKSLEHDRKVREVEDIVKSIVLPLSGLTLVYFFRRYILK